MKDILDFIKLWSLTNGWPIIVAVVLVLIVFTLLAGK